MRNTLLFYIILLFASCACEKDPKADLGEQVQRDDNDKVPNDTTIWPIERGQDLDSSLREGAEPDPLSPPKSSGPKWENYVISQGQHYNNLRTFGFFPHDSLAFEVVFDSTAMYQTQSRANQADWNKLMGFSDCASLHQTNSVRVVWRYLPANGGLQLGEYYYTDGKRSFATLGNYQFNDTIPVKIYTSNGFYKVQAGSHSGSKKRACSNASGRYGLYPYFGGDETAPQDINMFIRQLYP